VKELIVASLLLGANARADSVVDQVAALNTIGKGVKVKEVGYPTFAAGAGCGVVGATERAAIAKRVLGWLDREHPDEKAVDDGDAALVLNVGCRDPSGFVGVDVSQDRAAKTGGSGIRRNYILRVFADKLDEVEQRPSTPSTSWMEWADEGRLDLLGQLDLDGDGSLDLLIGHTDHEGGDPTSSTQVSVVYASGKTVDIAAVTELSAATLINGQLVIAGADKQQHVRFACVAKDLRLSPCPASASATKAAERRAIADRYANMTADDVPDRELLATELRTLGVKPAPELLAAAAATTPKQRAQRHVEAWLAKAGVRYDFESVIRPAQPEARVYLDRIETALGDRPCLQTPLSAADTDAVTAWVHRQDDHPKDLAIAPATCGAYAWASWSRDAESNRREVLLARGGPTRLLGFTWDVGAGMPGGPTEFAHSESFFAHGDAIVGIVIQAGNLWIVAGDKVVAQSKGSIWFYDYDQRTPEHSRDVVDDGGTLWHATPSGRDRLDLALVRDHEPRRAARNTVLGNEPSPDLKYLAALKMLGADAGLLAEVKALATVP
jgi:hypothetical protein